MILIYFLIEILKKIYNLILIIYNGFITYYYIIIPMLLLITIIVFKYFFKPLQSGSTYIVAKKKRGKTARLTLSALTRMKNKKLLKLSNEKINKLKNGGFENLNNVSQLVYNDFRVTKKSYYNKKILELQQKFDNKTISAKELEKLKKNVSNYISIFNVGAKHTNIKLFEKLTFPPYSLVQLDEINKGYNSRLSIDFPDAVATWHQTSGHNDLTFEMTAHRLPEADAKIRDIVDYYEHIRFYWEFKFYYLKFTKKFPFVSLKSRVWLSIQRVWHYTDINDIESLKKPHNLFTRMLRKFFMLPYESGRKLYIYLGGLRYHYDYQYLKPYHYDEKSSFVYVPAPFHNYNLVEYKNFIKVSNYERPLEFGRERKADKRKRLANEFNDLFY